MLSPTQMIEALAADAYVVRPNMSKTSTHKYVVLGKILKDDLTTGMKCIAQFQDEDDAKLFAEARRKKFIADASGRKLSMEVS